MCASMRARVLPSALPRAKASSKLGSGQADTTVFIAKAACRGKLVSRPPTPETFRFGRNPLGCGGSVPFTSTSTSSKRLGGFEDDS